MATWESTDSCLTSQISACCTYCINPASLSNEESRELQELLNEVKALNFNDSGDLSNYIIRNKLGYKYKNISGIVRMQKRQDSWDFKGGFPENIYRIVCQELGLKNRGSRAQVVGFTSFNNLHHRRERS